MSQVIYLTTYRASKDYKKFLEEADKQDLLDLAVDFSKNKLNLILNRQQIQEASMLFSELLKRATTREFTYMCETQLIRLQCMENG